jgi:uncharacterized protein
MDRLAELQSSIALSPSAMIAFSGGVDSSLVAAAAARSLGGAALAVTAVSPALATGELDGARAVARAVGIAHETVRTDELARAGYRRNGPDRCYHCKTELYETLGALAAERGYAALMSGANADDLGDWRPGLRAAAEHGVRHPLVEVGMGKEEIRAIARRLDIPSAEKPAAPCLASRLPYGTRVEPAVLRQVDRAERAVRALGFTDLRVRHLAEDVARVEIAAEDLDRARSEPTRTAIVHAVIRAGYDAATIAEEPLRSGSLNAGLRTLPIIAV